MPHGYVASETSVHFMNYHFVWCPKYRKPVVTGEVETRLKQLIHEKAEQLGCEVISLETMPDHVHLFIKANPTLAPNRIVGELKGFTSRMLRQEFRHLTTSLPTLWTRSYFVSTHGHVSSENIKKYIAEQKNV